MKIKAMQTLVAPPTQQHAGWDDEDLEVGLVYKVDEYHEGEENPLNTLYADNRGRFFLAQTGKIEEPCDMPWTAFHEISFEHAIEWSIHAQNNYLTSTGVTAKLLEHALELLRGAKCPA